MSTAKIENVIENIPQTTLDSIVDYVLEFRETSRDLRNEINDNLNCLNIQAAKTLGNPDLNIKSADINWMNTLIEREKDGEGTSITDEINIITKRLYLLKVYAMVSAAIEKRGEETSEDDISKETLSTLSNRLTTIFNLDTNMHDIEAETVYTISNRVIEHIRERKEVKEKVFNDIENIDEYTRSTPRSLYFPITNYIVARKPSKKEILREKLEKRSEDHKLVSKRIDQFITAGE